MSFASLCRRLFGGTATPTPQPVLLMQPVTAATPRPAVRRAPVRVVAVEPDRSRTRAATPRRRRKPEPVEGAAALVAARLVAACQTEPGLTAEILAEEMQEIYAVMVDLEGLPEVPWRDIGSELRRLTGGRKTYKWVLRDGQRHRLRVYRIPALTPTARRCAAAGSAGAGQRPGSRSLPVGAPIGRARRAA